LIYSFNHIKLFPVRQDIHSIFNLIKLYFLVFQFPLIKFNKRILKDKLLFAFINYILSYILNHENYLDGDSLNMMTLLTHKS
jgi:hypothetical protein